MHERLRYPFRARVHKVPSELSVRVYLASNHNNSYQLIRAFISDVSVPLLHMHYILITQSVLPSGYISMQRTHKSCRRGAAATALHT
jgi:hypothetical protein